MATASEKLVAGKAPARPGGDGGDGRSRFRAALAAGAAILGIAAALAFGVLRPDRGAETPPVGPLAPVTQRGPGGAVGSREWQTFMEWNLVLPDAGAGTTVATTPPRDWAAILFWEQNQLPELSSPAPGACLPGEIGACDR